MRYLVLLARALFSITFVMAPTVHFSHVGIAYATAHGLPIPWLLVPLSGAIACAGGVSVLLGFHAKVGGWLLVLFLVPVTFIMHNFWAIPDHMMMQVQRAFFLKNLALLGTALLIAYFGAGPLSLDRRAGRTETSVSSGS